MRNSKLRSAGSAILIGIAFLVLSLSVYLSPRDGQSMAVIAWPQAEHPGAAASLIVARAGGSFEQAYFAGRIVVARSANRGFANQLYSSGALLVFNPRILAGCRKT